MRTPLFRDRPTLPPLETPARRVLAILAPNLLLIDAAEQTGDAVIIAGGRGATVVAADPLACAIVARAPVVAAIGAGQDVATRAGVVAYCSADCDDIYRWLCDRLAVCAPTATASAHA